MEDLIYLILLMAWVVFALYRRSQKKNATARKASAQPEPQQDFKPMPTLQEILFGEEESYPGRAIPSPVTAADEGSYSPEPVETDFEKEYARRGIISVERQARASQMSEIQQSDLQRDEISDEIDTSDKKKDYFDLRKAVIYSEILNRPYV
jgi:hypothetical protein